MYEISVSSVIDKNVKSFKRYYVTFIASIYGIKTIIFRMERKLCHIIFRLAPGRINFSFLEETL